VTDRVAYQAAEEGTHSSGLMISGCGEPLREGAGVCRSALG